VVEVGEDDDVADCESERRAGEERASEVDGSVRAFRVRPACGHACGGASGSGGLSLGLTLTTTHVTAAASAMTETIQTTIPSRPRMVSIAALE
jgi:hypothetical protein